LKTPPPDTETDIHTKNLLKPRSPVVSWHVLNKFNNLEDGHFLNTLNLTRTDGHNSSDQFIGDSLVFLSLFLKKIKCYVRISSLNCDFTKIKRFKYQ
jgi:hypothetical protein